MTLETTQIFHPVLCKLVTLVVIAPNLSFFLFLQLPSSGVRVLSLVGAAVKISAGGVGSYELQVL